MDAATFTVHLLTTGLTPLQATRFLNHISIKCYSLATINRCQNAISPIILNMANESLFYWKSKMPERVGVFFDGAWAHARKAFQHMAVLIDSFHQKVVSSKILFKSYRNHPGNYDDSKAGNLMEAMALRSMNDDLLDPRIVSFTSDGDIKIRSIIKKLKLDNCLKITKDPGHVMFSISHTLRLLNSKNKNIFSPLIKNFEKFVKNIVLKIENPEHRENVYLNIASHYSGRHDPKL